MNYEEQIKQALANGNTVPNEPQAQLIKANYDFAKEQEAKMNRVHNPRSSVSWNPPPPWSFDRGTQSGNADAAINCSRCGYPGHSRVDCPELDSRALAQSRPAVNRRWLWAALLTVPGSVLLAAWFAQYVPQLTNQSSIVIGALMGVALARFWRLGIVIVLGGLAYIAWRVAPFYF